MIDKIDVTGNGYKVEDTFKKYVEKRIGKLDRYLPRGSKKDIICKVVVTAAGKSKREKYDISAAMEIPGGKVIAAKDECTNLFAGIDLVEAKLMGQIRRYKLDVQSHRQKKSWRKLFIRKK
ncbi:ribosome-associated translation inhibitor RaiA [Candidatus Saccharibacteria bacterium]|nr:ribosome-associated translation inhibitor RaiA [Candidatus Saccharibacteria bacterium]